MLPRTTVTINSTATATDHARDRGRRPRLQGEQPSEAGPFGLVGMRERVELLGGEFEIVSKPGGPTRITARLQIWRPPTAA